MATKNYPQLTPNKDEFIFDRDDCLTYTKYKNPASIFEGLSSLLSNEIIARGKTDYKYYINPMIAFNGNRITFAKTYVKNQKKSSTDPNQMSLLDQIEGVND